MYRVFIQDVRFQSQKHSVLLSVFKDHILRKRDPRNIMRLCVTQKQTLANSKISNFYISTRCYYILALRASPH